MFHGIAYNLPNYKALITGNAYLGPVIQLSAQSSGTDTSTNVPNVVQTNSSVFFDGSSTISTTIYPNAANINPPQYTFVVSSANATNGATYTNNGQTFTVEGTIASGTSLKTLGTGVPAASGTLTKASGTGDTTITFSSYGMVTIGVTTALSIPIWVPTVDADNINLAAIYNTAGVLIGNIQVVAYTSTSITLQAPLNAGWIIEGSITIK
jgi:hypothetical protein